MGYKYKKSRSTIWTDIETIGHFKYLSSHQKVKKISSVRLNRKKKCDVINEQALKPRRVNNWAH